MPLKQRNNRGMFGQIASGVTQLRLYAASMFPNRSQVGRDHMVLHKFVTGFDSEAESVACSATAELSLARALGAAPAAPAGGARSDWGRGCGKFGYFPQFPAQAVVEVAPVSRRSAPVQRLCAVAVSCVALVLGSGADAASGQGEAPAASAITVPSGQPVTLSEVLLDTAPGALWARFRFVAPQIAEQTTQEASATDIDFLCAKLAVPYLTHHALAPDRVVISLADRDLPFGSAAPEATQFFETYRVDDGVCVWEGF